VIHSRSTTNPTLTTSLRGLIPHQPLSHGEGLRLAERQADVFLEIVGCTEPPVSEDIVTLLPGVEVRLVQALPASGMTAWEHGRWQVRLNASEPRTRQRFTLAHEAKHILDGPLVDVIYRHLPSGPARDVHIESVCDHFAGSLLMPRRWIVDRWRQGQRDPATLAWTFDVSQQAVLVRLQVLELIAPLPRCATTRQLGDVALRATDGRRRGS
jgi:predicted transcriptional regulator